MIKYKCVDEFGITGIVEVEGRLFVTEDKDGKDVFAEDKIKATISDVSSEPLIGKIVPSKTLLSCWMFAYEFDGGKYLAPAPDLQNIELIEDK